MNQQLANYIKYCLGYVKLVRQQGFFSQKKCSFSLPKEYFSLEGLLNGEFDGKIEELINLELFYDTDPKDVTDEFQDEYKKEKELAKKIEEVRSGYLNDQYRKQIILNFGFFDIELPADIKEENNGEEIQEKNNQNSLFSKDDESEKDEKKNRRENYPLFSIPILIEKDNGQYKVFTADPEIQVNAKVLESILGEELYYQFLDDIGKYEFEEKLSVPIENFKTFQEIWHKIKAHLKLKEAIFDEKSFDIEEMQIALGPKVNYFLAEDLRKLSNLSEEELSDTSLLSWMSDEELNTVSDTPSERELYFPFSYDKYQLRILSLLGNKGSIIEGPPGTGKSQTISNLLCHLAAKGNKVLFVSQKAQALKVVKDKLKSTGVKYLYGYLPNPASSQVDETDELDGIAPQLSAMNAHIEKVENNLAREKKSDLASVAMAKENFILNANLALDTQRRVYSLIQEWRELQPYAIDITNFTSFKKCFYKETWKEIKELKEAIEKSSKKITTYETSKQKKRFDKIFGHLELQKTNYSQIIKELIDDVSTTGYDRHSAFFRKLNNLTRNVRLRKPRRTLPMELIDEIDKLLERDISKNRVIDEMSLLLLHCQHYELLQELENHKDKLHKSLSGCGVSDEEFDLIDSLIEKTTSKKLDDVKNKIIRTQEIRKEFNELKVLNQNIITPEIKKLEEERCNRIANYLQKIIDTNIIDKYNGLVSVRQKIKKLAKAFGKSKRAFKTFDRIRRDADNFNAILDLVPIWIMELDDASRIIPFESAIFDYVVLDEASQCNVAYTLPTMFRAKKIIFVGDSEQMRDNTVMFKSNKAFDELARRYQIPEELQIKSTGEVVQSVLNIATLRGFKSIPLKFHYRSPRELIGFSNQYFYKPKGKELIPLNNNYLTYGDTNRVILVHEIKKKGEKEFSDNVNVEEAEAILKFFKELREDKRYKDKSVGILTFFNNQATYIRELFEAQGFKEEKDNYKVSIIEGIQGDEKDIIIYSFVIRSRDQKRNYTPLTGEGGDIQGEINMGRVNVAFSRAKQQVHIFVSLPISEFPERIWLKKYLKYATENGEVDFYSTALKDFDSDFEKEFYSYIRSCLDKSYVIQNQVESCGFKIDFVVSNAKSGEKIAVECDGPTHFQNEMDEELGIYVESDLERQQVLESAGWDFYRLRYSDWVQESFDKGAITDDIKKILR